MFAVRVALKAVSMLAVLLLGLSTSLSSAGTFMAVGEFTSQPIGHFELCRAIPSECNVRSRDRGPMVLSDAWRAKIHNINIAVNREVTPLSDMEIYGQEEVWAYPVHGVGDCEDYVLEKRKRLHEAGISLSNLLITVVRKIDGEGHAVLTIRTSEGDIILDNLVDEIQVWNTTNYHYLKRQASIHSGRWVSLYGDNNLPVAAVRH